MNQRLEKICIYILLFNNLSRSQIQEKFIKDYLKIKQKYNNEYQIYYYDEIDYIIIQNVEKDFNEIFRTIDYIIDNI